MANVVCGGLKTLGVVLDVPGKTTQVLAGTHQVVDQHKLHYITEHPTIKFEAPVLADLSDLPIYPFPHGNVNQRNKWALDCILDWNGKFEGEAKDTREYGIGN
eukprot:7760818-Pyramimonas_sp.AAC.1